MADRDLVAEWQPATEEEAADYAEDLALEQALENAWDDDHGH